MLAPYSAKLDWNEYLRAAYVVDGVGQHVDRLNRGFQNLERRLGNKISSSIDGNATRIVASQQAFADIMEKGMGGIQERLQYQQSAIEDLQSEYSYQSGLQLDQLVIANTTLEGIKAVMKNICKLLARPIKTAHMDMFLQGCERLQRNYLPEALESFHSAEDKDKTHFFTQYHLGKLYLYGANEGEDVVDLEKAEQHLRLATRYGMGESRLDEKMRPLAAEAFLHASMACYLQAMKENGKSIGRNNLMIPGVVETVVKKLSEAFELVSKAIELNPRLGEAFYCRAKYQCIGGELMNDIATELGNNDMYEGGYEEDYIALYEFYDTRGRGVGIWASSSEMMLKDIENAIRLNRNYAVKITLDSDFDFSRKAFNDFIQKWANYAKEEAGEKLAKVKKSLEGTVMEFVDAEIFVGEYQKLALLHGKILCMPEFDLKEIAPSYYGRYEPYNQKPLISAGENLRSLRGTIESDIVSGHRQLAERSAFIDVQKIFDLAEKVERNYALLQKEMAKEPARLILGRKQELATIRKLLSGYKTEIRSRASAGRCIVCAREGFFGSIFMPKIDGLSFCQKHYEECNHVPEGVFQCFDRFDILH